jgi:hypothetical protein
MTISIPMIRKRLISFVSITMYHLFNFRAMKKLIISKQTFEEMIRGIIQSGVTFEATENGDGMIVLTFTGGF